ncbi:MAG TPA: PfkB family carbohydrate kinase, partial [Vicinamibacteria bacterium]
SYDLNARETIRTDLNVFERFRPKIPDAYRASSVVFLGNIDPVLQLEVLEQVERPEMVACDTMNFWIEGKPRELRRTLERVDVLLINDAEARQLSGEWNIVKAARVIRAMGPRALVIKKGEHGVLMFTDRGSFAAPAFPLEDVFDPTGAGDTFAGGFVGYVAGAGSRGEDSLRRAVIMGSTLASFCVEAFSLDRLVTLDRAQIDDRFRRFRQLTQFETI